MMGGPRVALNHGGPRVVLNEEEAEEGVGTYGANGSAFSVVFFTTDGRASLFLRTYNMNRNMLIYVYVYVYIYLNYYIYKYSFCAHRPATHALVTGPAHTATCVRAPLPRDTSRSCGAVHV